MSGQGGNAASPSAGPIVPNPVETGDVAVTVEVFRTESQPAIRRGIAG